MKKLLNYGKIVKINILSILLTLFTLIKYISGALMSTQVTSKRTLRYECHFKSSIASTALPKVKGRASMTSVADVCSHVNR